MTELITNNMPHVTLSERGFVFPSIRVGDELKGVTMLDNNRDNKDVMDRVTLYVAQYQDPGHVTVFADNEWVVPDVEVAELKMGRFGTFKLVDHIRTVNDGLDGMPDAMADRIVREMPTNMWERIKRRFMSKALNSSVQSV